jgi:hypothetical protein
MKPSLAQAHRPAIFPVLVGWYSVLALAAGNRAVAGGVVALGPVLLLATGLGLAAWLVAAVVSRDADRRTILSVALVVWFTGYSTFATPLRALGGSELQIFLVTSGAVALFGALLVRSRRSLARAGRFVRVLVVILAAFPLLDFARAAAGGRPGVADAAAASAPGGAAMPGMADSAASAGRGGIAAAASSSDASGFSDATI